MPNNSRSEALTVLSEESDQLWYVINDQDDCTVVLKATSYLDRALSLLLDGFLLSGDTSRELLEAGGALETFASRAALAYALGLIPKGLYTNLRTLSQMRNRFAHEHTMLDLSDPELEALASKLTLPTVRQNSVDGQTGASVKTTTNNWGDYENQGARCRIVFVTMVQHLIVAARSVERRSRPNREW